MLVDKKSFINLSVEEFVRTFMKLKKNMQDFMLSLILIFMVQHSILNGDERHNQFSNQGEDEPAGDIFAIFDRQDYSRVRCGILCLDDQCCEEFLYSASTRRCIGRHFMWFSSSSSDNAAYTTYEGMTSYKKGCETGWLEFKGHCYIEGQSLATWNDANLQCKKMCSHLVEIDSQDENDWLTMTMLKKENCGTYEYENCTSWTGGNDIQTEGSYMWDHSNTNINYTNWHPDEPSLIFPNDTLTRDCIDLLRTGLWNDRPCSYLNSFICEKFSDESELVILG
ncbi:uncharacterized protein [Magallana gigas]|uniref:uncharacterized protein n=1 Tax=Magallana gigas TaxID=29159 RepID=UPI003340AFA0